TAADPFRGIEAADATALPGDLFLLHKGVYPGPVTITQSGTAEAPIVWRAAGDGEVLLDGPDKGLCMNVRGRRHLFFEGLTFTKSSPSMRVGGASFITVRRCRFRDIYWGIVGAQYQERLCIVDCTFTGPRTWPRNAAQNPLGENRAIEISGVGHVIAYNRMSGFRDGADTRPGWPIRGVDIHNNDISEMTDDGIELDASESNCRAYLNRITNCYVGISFQPSRGGPNYAVRNALYNLSHETWKLHFTPPGEPLTSGGVILHNTVVRRGSPMHVWAGNTPVQRFFMRNNLYVVSGAKRAIDMQCDVDFADWDYDVIAGGPYEIFGKWSRTFHRTRDDFVKGTGQEAHATCVESTKGIFATDLQPPEDDAKQAPVTVNDLRLAGGSPAIDKGTPLANINDGYRGNAPDAGAFELGDPLPHYGPRPE
ncbi:MAG TPA: right-handed parallel beta-helix repeat-containing protein, partial [Planctomycetota bacterium]|nr:right-handed parallel beta-helix repeat-containing protein [Planctomycetota bacterium]